MRTSTPRTTAKSPPARRVRLWSRFGYDHRWWGQPPRESVGHSYWYQTRRPLTSLAFVAPILLAYEGGMAWLPEGEVARAGADAWLRQGLGSTGLANRGLVPLMLVLGLLGWHACDSRDWRFRPATLVGMVVESLALAVALIGLGHLVDRALDRLEPTTPLAVGLPMATLVGYLGAGLYEEALFRLALIPPLFWTCRILQAPGPLAGTVAVTASALAFSMAHHAGSPGEVFTWFAFLFRWTAGVFFAWVFVRRGFGVAVGTHTVYDILVGQFGRLNEFGP